MAKLLYSAIASLDGFIEDPTGSFEWAVPDEEVHAFINDLMRPIGTYLYGRRLYELMASWETDPRLAEQSPAMRDFARIWQAAEKVVYSTTLTSEVTSKTRIKNEFAPRAVREMKEIARSPLVIGGPELAGHAFRAGLVDECHLFLVPIVVGAGKRSLPRFGRIELILLEERAFPNGMVYLRYRVGT